MLYSAFCLVCVYALSLLYIRGYTIVVVLLGLLVAYLLWGLRRDSFVTAQLHWNQGRWTLEHGGVRTEIFPTRRSTVTPWVIYLAFTQEPQGPGGHLWLYMDSAPRAQLRRLRVRLNLEG